MKHAFLIKKEHFEIEEVNFFNLKIYSNNIILEYSNEDNKYFRRSLFETERLRFDVGVLIRAEYINNIDSYIKEFINNIKGFEIKLGVWIEQCDKGIELYNKLIPYKDNFILGLKGEFEQFDYIPIWKSNGDIEDDGDIKLGFISYPVPSLNLNTDYKTIYNENNLKPILSTHEYK